MSLKDPVDVAELQKKIAELMNENESLKKQKKFGLVWEDKPDAQVLRVRNEAPMLCEDSSKAVVGDATDTNHILINGDNFHALTALRATHMGKIDVIYIDPPYNTGNKDFIYNDNFLDKEDGYRHSKWLSFIEKRLTLAKELLSDTGVIFVSIDDNEQARLKLLMDEVFGPENFIANLAVSYNPHGRSITRFFADNHEYILSYVKNINKTDFRPRLGSLVDTNDYNLEDENGKYRLGAILNTSKKFSAKNRPNLYYPIYVNSKTLSVSLQESGDFNIPVFPAFEDGTPGVWRWGKDKMEVDGWKIIGKKRRDGSWFVVRKDYLATDKTIALKTHLNYEVLGTNGDANKKLISILGDQVFDYPKHPKTISTLVESVQNPSAIILDFFAGSGTTAHAVAELNKKDGGSRQCILVTDGGKTEVAGESAKNAKGDTINIAEEITYERVRRVLTGKDWADKKEHEPLGGNLRYFNVVMEHNPYGATERDQRLTLEKYTIEHAKIAENVFDVVTSKDDFDEETLTAIDYKVFASGTQDSYLVGVNSHDYILSELEEWFAGLPLEAKVIIVGNGVEEIGWVKNNSDRIYVDDVLGRTIRSRKYVASKLPLG